MEINFEKYHGTGNDFIMIDNRDGQYNAINEQQINSLCDRHFGIGADGLILLQMKDGFDFWMNYFNADGKPSSMCGNGSRCTVAFAHSKGIVKNIYHFVTADGPHEGEILPNGNIKVKMADVQSIDTLKDAKLLDTGSPHYIKDVTGLNEIEVKTEGKKIRYNEDFSEKGVNVNFVEKKSDGQINVRTYERGVEDETLSCGTGVTACAIVNAYQEGENKIDIKTPGGDLVVTFNKNENSYNNIWLEGPTKNVFEGIITI